MKKHMICLVSLTTTALLSSGCRSIPETVPYARAFPESHVQREVLDIQVFRDDTHIEFVNTTGREFGPSTIWLNQRYGCPIELIEVGQYVKIALEDFRDEYSDKFRDASFFATETPERLMMAQIETSDPANEGKSVLLGLIVVGFRE